MADQGAHVDYPAHERAYHRFLRFSRTGAVAVFVIAFIVVLIIAR